MQQTPEQTPPKRRWIAWVLTESTRLAVAMPWERDAGRRPTAANATRE